MLYVTVIKFVQVEQANKDDATGLVDKNLKLLTGATKTTQTENERLRPSGETDDSSVDVNLPIIGIRHIEAIEKGIQVVQ